MQKCHNSCDNFSSSTKCMHILCSSFKTFPIRQKFYNLIWWLLIPLLSFNRFIFTRCQQSNIKKLSLASVWLSGWERCWVSANLPYHCCFYLAQEIEIFFNKLWPTFFFSHALFYQIYHEDTKSLGASRPDSLVVGRTVNESRGGDR